MSELPSDYDPMSLHPDVEGIYTSPEVVEHGHVMRSIAKEEAWERDQKRRTETIHRSDLFGGYDDDPQTIDNPPVVSEG